MFNARNDDFKTVSFCNHFIRYQLAFFSCQMNNKKRKYREWIDNRKPK